MKEVVQGLGITTKAKNKKNQLITLIYYNLCTLNIFETVFLFLFFTCCTITDQKLTTKHQVDKSHLHPPCQLKGRGGNSEHFET